MMKLAALVPLNGRAQAKTRLAGALAPQGRAELARWLARRVLGALHEAQIAYIAVVSPDDAVLRWARRNGARAIRQRSSGLNAALDLGRAWALRHDADALLVALGDLPLLAAYDVATLAEIAATAPASSVTLAPDRAGQGTNLLLLRPATAIPFAFGADSLARHSALARAAGIEPQVVRLPGAAFDVDTPTDLRELAERGLWAPATYRRWSGEAS
jgi:2-phospho-L-lactate/phosphoenolpyruvate guanylyltransferase